MNNSSNWPSIQPN